MVIIWLMMVDNNNQSGWWLEPTPLKKYESVGMIIPIIPYLKWKKTCLKPPTGHV